MAKTQRWHISKSGNPGICNPKITGRCGLGGNSGKENHYGTFEETQKAIEKFTEEQFGAVSTLKKGSVAEDSNSSSIADKFKYGAHANFENNRITPCVAAPGACPFVGNVRIGHFGSESEAAAAMSEHVQSNRQKVRDSGAPLPDGVHVNFETKKVTKCLATNGCALSGASGPLKHFNTPEEAKLAIKKYRNSAGKPEFKKLNR